MGPQRAVIGKHLTVLGEGMRRWACAPSPLAGHLVDLRLMPRLLQVNDLMFISIKIHKAKEAFAGIAWAV